MAFYSPQPRRGPRARMTPLGAPQPDMPDWSGGTAPVRQPQPLQQPPAGGPMPFILPQGGDEMAPVRQPGPPLGGGGAFGAGPMPGVIGEHDDFMNTLPVPQQRQMRDWMGGGMPFNQAYQMWMQRTQRKGM